MKDPCSDLFYVMTRLTVKTPDTTGDMLVDLGRDLSKGLFITLITPNEWALQIKYHKQASIKEYLYLILLQVYVSVLGKITLPLATSAGEDTYL